MGIPIIKIRRSLHLYRQHCCPHTRQISVGFRNCDGGITVVATLHMCGTGDTILILYLSYATPWSRQGFINYLELFAGMGMLTVTGYANRSFLSSITFSSHILWRITYRCINVSSVMPEHIHLFCYTVVTIWRGLLMINAFHNNCVI